MFNIESLLETKHIFSNRHLERYKKFINFYLKIQNKITENYEIHHILPKSLFPEYEKEKNNLIKLSYRAHYIAHYLLSKIYKNSMIYAFYAMNNKNIKNGRLLKLNSIFYSHNKILFSKTHSVWHNSSTLDKSMLNKDYIGNKTKETKLSKGENYYKEISEKSAKTIMTTIEENGLTIAQNRALKTAIKIKENGSLKGANSSNAKVIRIYDKNNNLKYEFFGDFFSKCKELSLPSRAFKTSYSNNGKPIYTTKCGTTVAHNNGYSEYIGWYAICICRTRDY